MASSGLQVRRSLRRHDEEPLALLVNLFECGIVLALGVALQLSARDATAGSATGGTAVPEARAPVPHYRVGEGASDGEGRRLGIAWQLGSGDVVFVPEGTVPR